MISTKVLPILVLSLFALASAQLDNVNNVIDYSVIKLLNETDTMGVMVDNVTYPLQHNASATKILHTGKAPVAKQGYQYVKITKSNNNTEVESFLRQPSLNDTPNEFYNRTWNTRQVPQLPVVYEPLSAINRIKTNLHVDGQIPTIHLMGNQTQFDILHRSNLTEDISVETSMSYVSLNDTLNYQGVEISLAGRSSRWMPKLSYNVKLSKKDRLYDFRRVKLRALDTDPSYIREQLAYKVIENVGLLSSRFSYVRVLMNDQELGLFGIIETFQDPWLANSFANGSASYKNGNLYQGVFTTAQASAANHTSDLAYYKNNLTAYEDGQYKVKVQASDSGKNTKDDFKPLMKFTEFIDSAPTNGSDVVKVWNKQLDTDSFLHAMALEILLGYADGYISMADNYYLYQNLDVGNYFYIPSDMDLTFGSTMFNLTDMWSGNVSTFPGYNTRPLMNKILQVPEFKQQYDELLVNITQNLVNPVHMNDFINGLVDMLKEDIEWDGSLTRVAKNVMAGLMDNFSDNSSMPTGISDIIGNQVPPNINMKVMQDFDTRMNATIPLKDAVNGPTGHISLAGIKEWISTESNAILKFYNAANTTTTPQ